MCLAPQPTLLFAWPKPPISRFPPSLCLPPPFPPLSPPRVCAPPLTPASFSPPSTFGFPAITRSPFGPFFRPRPQAPARLPSLFHPERFVFPREPPRTPTTKPNRPSFRFRRCPQTRRSFKAPPRNQVGRAGLSKLLGFGFQAATESAGCVGGGGAGDCSGRPPPPCPSPFPLAAAFVFLSPGATPRTAV